MTSTDRLPIVVGVDGSTGSDDALDWAVTEARTTGRALHLVHAFGIDPLIRATNLTTAAGPQHSDVLLDRAAARVAAAAPDLALTVTATPGFASSTLVGLSRSAWLVVVGARGRGALAGTLLGSVSLQVSTHAAGPVVVVRGASAPTQSRRPVVVGVDGSDASHQAVGFAMEQASRRGSLLVVVHAWILEFIEGVVVTTDASPEWARLAARHQELVEASLGPWPQRFPTVEVTRRVIRDATVPGLLAESAGAELLVVGSRGRGGFAGLLLGSVGHGLLPRAACPVAVVRPRVSVEAAPAPRLHSD